MTAALSLQDIQPGFADPVYDAQRIFRRLMDAMARPGRIVDIDADIVPPVPGLEGLSAIALTVLDFETPVYLPSGEMGEALSGWLRFHCGCPVTTDPQEAAFAILSVTELLPISAFNSGDPKYPDRSTTLLLACPALEGGKQVSLTGPGIKEVAHIAPSGIPDGFWNEVMGDRSQFQLGVDIIMGTSNAVIGLPRTTRINEES
jgi:alpha-D-ribose 1-methylphosphonate 5-triphosphate synthase subunit PhnH